MESVREKNKDKKTKKKEAPLLRDDDDARFF